MKNHSDDDSSMKVGDYAVWFYEDPNSPENDLIFERNVETEKEKSLRQKAFFAYCTEINPQKNKINPCN